MANIEHKESHGPDHVDLLSPFEQSLLGGEIGVYDARFISLLTELREEGEITYWKRFPDNSPEDIAGVDYLVTIEGNEIPFQITGGYRDALRRKNKHPDIPVIYFLNRNGPSFRTTKISKKEILWKANDYLNK